MPKQAITPVVLCGGSGTRLWPLSRKTYPKQFSELFEGDTLFQRTLKRVSGPAFAKPILLTHQDFRFIAAEQLGAAGHEAERIVVEPDGRNTAPAICLAALVLEESDPDAVMLVLPSDHVMNDVPAFHAAVEAGAGAAREGALVTFGITPDRPETGYGYIELEARPEAGAQPFVKFVEKPDEMRA
ncbi:MAG: sugar phosphate nucleotidyltransferase, partial [Pseudomonadota bacterium]